MVYEHREARRFSFRERPVGQKENQNNACMAEFVPCALGLQVSCGFHPKVPPEGAVQIRRDLLQERRMSGLSFWATGYSVSTAGLDEQRVRQYIREQEKLESGQGELDLK